jgi:hypothetical protein
LVNLDDTRRCPVGSECEGCGRLDELAVMTGDTPVGVLCMTLCDACDIVGVLPILSPPEETARVLKHGQHVGVDVDQMTGEGDLASPRVAAASGVRIGEVVALAWAAGGPARPATDPVP